MSPGCSCGRGRWGGGTAGISKQAALTTERLHAALITRLPKRMYTTGRAAKFVAFVEQCILQIESAISSWTSYFAVVGSFWSQSCFLRACWR